MSIDGKAPKGAVVDTPAETITPAGEKLIFAPHEPQYTRSTLSRTALSPSPIIQFHNWFKDAVDAGVPEPETVVLSTAQLPTGQVSARAVYLKELESDEKTGGFIIYSNFETSRKSADLRTNPYCSLTFYWREMERQVRVEGMSERLSPEQSQAYFDTRSRMSRIGAWASQQSKEIDGREVLEERVNVVEKRFEGIEQIPVPEFWGGLRIRPINIEFWQGRLGRLHDRFVYERENVDLNEWVVKRLSP